MVIQIVWLKYLPFIIVGLTFLYVAYKIMVTKHLLEFFKKSLCDDRGKPSGRSIAGFACINSMLAGFFVSMYYAKDHTPPDWYVWTLATLIGSFYGLKELGKFAKGGQVPGQDAIPGQDPGQVQAPVVVPDPVPSVVTVPVQNDAGQTEQSNGNQDERG